MSSEISPSSVLLTSKKDEQTEKSVTLLDLTEIRSQSKLLPPELEKQVNRVSHTYQNRIFLATNAKVGKKELKLMELLEAQSIQV